MKKRIKYQLVKATNKKEAILWSNPPKGYKKPTSTKQVIATGRKANWGYWYRVRMLKSKK